MALEDYLLLPVTMPASSIVKHDLQHLLYICKNTPKPPIEDDGRTLFVANLPVDSTVAHFRAIFSSMGARIEKLQFHSLQDTTKFIAPEDIPMELDSITDETFSKEVKRLKRASVLPTVWTRTVLPTGSTAHITFVESAELETVLKSAKEGVKTPLIWGAKIPPGKVPTLGKDWLLSHIAASAPAGDALQQSVDAYMELFNQEEILRRRKQKLMRSEPDEDGFVTITRGGRTGAGRTTDAEKLAKVAEGRGIVKDLYRFQRRDKHKEQMSTLRMKFEEDKRKIQELRARRRFLA